MDPLDLTDVAHDLQLPSEVVSWLAGLRDPDPSDGPLVLPVDSVADRWLEQLDVDARDRADTLAARPSALKHPAHWWVLSRLYHDELARMGSAVPISGFSGWPRLPLSSDPVAMHLYVWAILALLPAVRRHHASLGVTDSVSWASLDLGDPLRAHRIINGVSGLGLFNAWSPPLRMRGAHYRLGRLEFNRGEISLGNGACGVAIAVHIPGGSPLDAAQCSRSLDDARAFFVRHYPQEPPAFFTCESWLMDPQLAEHLAPTSNIVRFQQRFSILPFRPERDPSADVDVLEYAFGRAGVSWPVPAAILDELPQETSLQRAYVSHLRSGGHWYKRTGWMPFS